ncbi:terminase [Embleya sp. NPDC005971]|uniref:terminase n=1 Tax=Embleya sp. NPDC005971 TaxID=3156724 RepID=UPI0033D05254
MLPEFTLGWHALSWTATSLQHGGGKPWRYTPEQARLTLWWYAVDPETSQFVYRDGVLQRLKGWGKDPMVATWAAFEFIGPCRPSGEIAEEGNPLGVPAGQPVGMQHPEAWVQLAAVSQDQTRNTMTLFPGLFTKATIEAHRIDLGKEIIYADKGRARIEAVTSSPRALEGGRPTATYPNETHHWIQANEGHEMAAVIERNGTKSPDGMSRNCAITNAFNPGEDSVAERTRDAFESMSAEEAIEAGIFYDSLEAPPEAKLSADWAPKVLEAVRGDSTWLSIPRIVKSILDKRNPPSRSRRYWYNQVVAAEDAWLSRQEWDACKREDIEVLGGERVVMFFDGSKSDDATGLVGCRVSDGHVFTVGVWQRPSGLPADERWTVPREAVDGVVDAAFARWRVVAFWADPGSGEDDTGQLYWDGYIDDWAQRYGKKLLLHAVASGPKRHAVRWDMGGSTSANQEAFTGAVKRTRADILERSLTHDGNRRLRQHVVNARRRTNRWGYTIGKEHRESARKIDLAVCAVGARHMRRMLMNSPAWTKTTKRTPGKGRVIVLR